MTVYDIYSKRAAREAKSATPEILVFDDFPREFRVQVIHVWGDIFDNWTSGHVLSPRAKYFNGLWRDVERLVARELGLFFIGRDANATPDLRCKQFLLDSKVPEALSITEITFRIARNWAMGQHLPTFLPIAEFDHQKVRERTSERARLAIEELNARFKEHSLGYQFENAQIIRVDSYFLHTTAVKPALVLLNRPGYEGAAAEFAQAYEHYLKDEVKESIANALKAFESTMKIVCANRGWSHSKDATAKELLDVVFKNQLISSELQSQFAAVRATLESGLPVVRNKNAGHGQGPAPLVVPSYLAAYALHLAASNIVLLVEAERAMK